MGLPNASPFCMKLETWLRMAQLPYEAPPPTLRHMGRAPKGKLPYIVDGGTARRGTGVSAPAGPPFLEACRRRSNGSFPRWLGAGCASSCAGTAWVDTARANLLWVPVESALKLHAQQYPQMLAYCQRMRERYYPQ